MKALYSYFFFYLFWAATLLGAEEASEKTYPERLKEAASEKLKQSRELYEKGVKVASEKYAESFEDGKALSEKSKEMILKDLKNIGDWEYKIENFSLENPKDLEIRLNQLGSERWQCFWVEPVNGNTKSFYFKRTKMSYLSKIPTGAILRMMADLQNN